MEIQMCTEETIDQPLAREATALNAEIAALAKVALRIQAERNEAIRSSRRRCSSARPASTARTSRPSANSSAASAHEARAR
jgi:hypothetical protein